MLYINPHVSLYFRPEVHMVSEDGLNAYGAVTWGQFFIYQGFNSFLWLDAYIQCMLMLPIPTLKKLRPAGNGFTYLYDGKQLPLKKKPITIAYNERAGNGKNYYRGLLYPAMDPLWQGVMARC